MAKFLNTSATNYFLEELIKEAKDRLILISPFLKLNDRIKELLSDKNRLKIDVRIVYGKNESLCIITSLNLYEFSQVNNNEMGVLIQRSEDTDLYRDAYEEAQRIIRVSEEVRISLERVTHDTDAKSEEDDQTTKLTSSKLAQKLGLKTGDLMEKLVATGFLELKDGKHYLTPKGKDAGGEFRGSKYGAYLLWPESFKL